jgi:AraC-like DNA-binding protein
MPEPELVTRVATGALAALLSVLLFQAGKSNRVYLATALLFLCILGYLIAPVLLRNGEITPLANPAVLLANLAPVSFWYLASTIFNDDFSPSRYLLPLVVATGLLGMAGFLTGPQLAMNWLDWGSQAVKLAWVAAAFFAVFREWRADLVEPRRQVRRMLVTLTGVYMIAIMVVELFIDGEVPADLELLNVLVIMVLVGAVALHMLVIDSENIFARVARPESGPAGDLSPLAREVLALMANDRTYATEGLTLRALAEKLRTRPPALREVINGELGHRNFNSFINLYRIEEVAARLELPEYGDTPLLTLALDAGFRSLAPFNRAFRDHFGVTPSAYRSSIKVKNN